jgi:hypothetical protein
LRTAARGAVGVMRALGRTNVATEIKQKIQRAIKSACEIELTAFI